MTKTEYFDCPFCGYKNARVRLGWFKQCLRCGKQLKDDRRIFRVKLLKELRSNDLHK